jgi:general L-amino acid transport system substrate-binding protein
MNISRCGAPGRRLTSLCLAGLAVLMAAASTAAAEPTLELVKKRGTLVCGVNGDLRGFSSRATGSWMGLDVDMCRAVAAAVLGDAGKVDFVPLSAMERFAALQAGKVDMLARNSTVTLQRSAEGAQFAAIDFYDGQAFAVPNKLGIKALSLLGGARICLVRGTTHEVNLATWFGARRVRYEPVVFDTDEAMIGAFFASRCTAMTQDASALASTLAARNKQADYTILPERISREPLGPFVRRGDDQWLDIVRWSFQAMLAAEELDLRRDNVQGERQSHDPEVKRLLGRTPGNGRALGLDEDWAFDIIHQVGNYGESFERNVGSRSMLKLERGANALWTDGGLMYPLPMR